ncbi:hypothetical protein KM043_004043 [Ampulex compressa]|nr:hypothetical protein KM043_004043 [Ampulex compressa]
MVFVALKARVGDTSEKSTVNLRTIEELIATWRVARCRWTKCIVKWAARAREDSRREREKIEGRVRERGREGWRIVKRKEVGEEEEEEEEEKEEEEESYEGNGYAVGEAAGSPCPVTIIKDSGRKETEKRVGKESGECFANYPIPASRG